MGRRVAGRPPSVLRAGRSKSTRLLASPRSSLRYVSFSPLFVQNDLVTCSEELCEGTVLFPALPRHDLGEAIVSQAVHGAVRRAVRRPFPSYFPVNVDQPSPSSRNLSVCNFSTRTPHHSLPHCIRVPLPFSFLR